MKHAHLIFPHQLFKDNPLVTSNAVLYLIEEHLFFKQYPFHKQKIALHRTSMKCYENHLISKGFQVVYVETHEESSDVRLLIPKLKLQGIDSLKVIDPVDNWLERRLKQTCEDNRIHFSMFESPLFLNPYDEHSYDIKRDVKRYNQTTFYIKQRKNLSILIDENGKPEGGKWTYDTENRKKYPAGKTAPIIQFPDNNAYYEEAKLYIEKHFTENVGNLTEQLLYPTDFVETDSWFNQFLEQRFMEFGTYEDAIVAEESYLNHSVLTPMLNIGLITPREVVCKSLEYGKKNNVPINSVEGFIRQIIGWREFIRIIYESSGTRQRTLNYWDFKRKIPESFYTGTTGIEPVDKTIKKVLKTGYCHHIERLMVLGNFMLLCEFDPNEVYRWFMEFFIDSYDWVMVPNVYGMSQFSDGGLMATKPYISGSNYLLKMSNYKKGDWQYVWDGLFWSFMDKHRSFFLTNPRLGMLVRNFDKMPVEKKQRHHENAKTFLESLN